MQTSSKKLVSWLIALLVVTLAAYWYWSPHIVLYQMARAAQEHDADAFNAHVDYLRLRESIKGQIAARMSKEMESEADKDNPFTALGSMLGLAMAGNLVDAMVRPEVVMYAMQHDGHLDPKAAARSTQTPAADAAPQKAKWAMERSGTDTVLVYPGEDDVAKAKAAKNPTAVFERSGFANWKLTELRLPER